ncbi:MAG: MBL fold metallo-hydrolase [Fimbriimonadales bacterium]|nr:MBL fold metallo-hydrolase [Fimbriimonadales bacterium]
MWRELRIEGRAMPNTRTELIDLQFLGYPLAIAAYLLDDGVEAALVEVGPTSTATTLLREVQARGVPLERVRHLIVTHIHLDHAGALGWLLQRLPNAVAYVHPVGAPHMVDPSRLIASASRLYGEMMERLWGEVVPIPQERLRIVRDGERIEVAGRVLLAVDTPGHARHHHAYLDEATGTLFAGDVAGVRMPGTTYVRPPTPPPELDVEAWQASLAKLRALPIQQLALTHFGLYGDVERHLNELEARLLNWAEFTRHLIEQGVPDGELIQRMRDYGNEEMRQQAADPSSYDLGAGYELIALGYARYWRKKLGLT